MQNIGDHGGRAFFLLVFPMFFAYQALAAFGAIPPAIGGGLTLFCGISLVALAPTFLTRVAMFWPSIAWLSALIIIVTGYAGYYWLFGLDYQRTNDVALSSLKLVVSWGGLFCIGLLVSPSAGFRKVLFWAVVLMAGVTPFLIKTPALSLLDTVRAGWNVASYQFFAGAFVFPAILLIGYSWGRRSEPWLVALALATIVLLLSRSEQAGMVAVAFGWAILKILSSQWRQALLGAAASAAFIAGALFLVPFAPVSLTAGMGASSHGPHSIEAGDIVGRQMELTNIAGSESWGEREKALNGGIDDILRSPIIGDYAGQIRDFGASGAYIHNSLSAWRQYGLATFLLYIVACVASFAVPAWRVFRWKERDPLWLSAAMVGGYCLLLVIGAKSIYWQMPALSWGMTGALYVRAYRPGLKTAYAAP